MKSWEKIIAVFILTLGVIIVFSGFQALGQEKYTVTGSIGFKETEGQLVVNLKTFDEFEKHLTPPSDRVLILIPNQKELEKKNMAFKFTDVPNDKYCVRCIHDLNSNGKMDLVPNVGIPAEPHAFSGKYMWEPLWEDVSFKVDKDINGIKINF